MCEDVTARLWVVMNIQYKGISASRIFNETAALMPVLSSWVVLLAS